MVSARSWPRRCRLCLSLALSLILGFACGPQEDSLSEPDLDLVELALIDESRPLERRLLDLQALRLPLSAAQVEGLLRVMKDKSQQAFIAVPDKSALGYHVEESPYGGPDERAELRWTAMMTIERLKVVEAIPDLLSAIHDRHPVVRVHAAAALWTLGGDQGIPVLLKGLEGKALENEASAAQLRRLTSQEFGFSTDGGWTNKQIAAKKWGDYAAEHLLGKGKLPTKGQDKGLDRRVAFLVDVLGQHQFLFMEQSRRSLGQLGDLAVAHLKDRLSGDAPSGNQQLRAYGVQALERITSSSARGLLRERLQSDQDASVRARAAKALGRLKDQDSRAALTAALSDADEGVVIAAARACGQVGGPMKSGERTVGTILLAFVSDLKAAPRLRNTAAVASFRLGLGLASKAKGPASERILEGLLKGALEERSDLAEQLEEWRGDLMGYDPLVAGDQQAASLARWRELLATQ